MRKSRVKVVCHVLRPSCQGMISYIADRYACGAEIGVGHCPDVALSLRRSGVRVFATDIRPHRHQGLRVLVDDVTDPDVSMFVGVEVIYSVRPPVELVHYMKRLAKAVSSDLIVKTLSCEYPPGGQLTGSGRSAFFLWRHL